MIQENHQVIQNGQVSRSIGREARKKGGIIFEGMSTEVIENTYRKNVRFWSSAEVIEN